jgi:hypothetical protein
MDLRLDRLSLRVAGLSEADGRRLARLVAECLVSAELPGGPFALDRLRVDVAPRLGETLASTARRIAAELLHALARSS